MNSETLEYKGKLLGSLLLFTQVFYKLRTGREFVLSLPDSQESHFITVSKALTKTARGESKKLVINIPPRWGKTELVIHYIAWTLARYPDSNFIYVSYSHALAKKQTKTIRSIINMPLYRRLFDVNISDDSSAMDNFETTAGGSVYAAGAGGTITGRGAGLSNAKRFGGAIVIDDIHKPSEVTSDTMRESINDWYYNTLQSRLNSSSTPIIFIGQRLHEDDLAGNLLKTGDWDSVILPALNIHSYSLYPEKHTRLELLKMKEESPYVFSAQYQQDPQPSGGGIFKPEWFNVVDEEPHIISTFITADTAETDKNYNDATVFSFWGLHKIVQLGREIDVYGLFWLDCHEVRIEPKDLLNEFMDFYSKCMNHKVRPTLACIEKKSTGVTLYSILRDIPGIQIINLERMKGKTERFLEIQPYVSQKLISLPVYGKHTQPCIEHCRKITANNSHRFDDIADTLADSVKIALIDKLIIAKASAHTEQDVIVKTLAKGFRKSLNVLRNSYNQ